MECGAMHFGEFNPLDVLATAATLQTSHDSEGGSGLEDDEGEGDDAEDGGPKTTFLSPDMPRVVKVKPKMTLRDGARKTLTVLRLPAKNADHSYAVYRPTQGDKPRPDHDDEGYCSRSSLGSPGTCWKSDSDTTETDVFDVATVTGDMVSPKAAVSRVAGSKVVTEQAIVDKVNGVTGKKPTKIVIVSRDANIHKLFAHPPSAKDGTESSNAENNARPKEGTLSEPTLLTIKSPSVIKPPLVTGTKPLSVTGIKAPSPLASSDTKSPSLTLPPKDDLVELSPTTGVLSVVDNDKQKTNSVPDTSKPDSCSKCGEKSASEETTTCLENSKHVNDSCDKIKLASEEAKTSHSQVLEERPSSEATKTASVLPSSQPGLSGNSLVAGKKIINVSKELTKNGITQQEDQVEGPTEIIDCDTIKVDHEDTKNETAENNNDAGSGSEAVAADDGMDQTPAPSGSAAVTSPVVDLTTEESEEAPADLAAVSCTDATSSCATATGEHSLTQKPVEPSGERKQQHPQSSHKMLTGLLAAGRLSKPAKPATQTVLLPAGQLCKLTNGSTALTSAPSPTNNKAGVVYLVSSSQPPVAVTTTAGKVSLVDKSAMTKASNQYIIQDDVPPVAKFSPPATSAPASIRPLLAPALKAPTSKLCAVQPRGIAPKDSWVVIKSGVPLATKGQPSLVTMGPGMRSVVPAGTACTMVPLLVNNPSAPRSKSLLPIAAKLSAPKASPGVLCTQSILNKAAIIQPKPAPDTTESIPAPPLSSHSLLPVTMPTTAEEDKPDSTATTSTTILDIKTSAGDPEATDSDTDTKSEVEDAIDLPGTMTPVTPASGRTTPAYEGRLTPLGFTSSSSESSPSPGGGKINIKISGGVVVDVQQEQGPKDTVCMAKRSIGQVGSLSWQGMSPLASPVLKTPLTLTTTPKHNRPKVAKPLKSELALQLKKRKKLKLKLSNPSKAELFRMRETAQSMSELHPLIDHDYCMFTEFSADIQSSIIATTESKLKTDKKAVKKNKAARTKPLDESPVKSPATPAASTSEAPKLKKRKYTKRKLSVLLASSVEDEEPMEEEDLIDDGDLSIASPQEASPISGKKTRDRRPKRRYRPRNSGDKNYVKIPGSYQDQFVYYATKKNRGRPRKYEGVDDQGFTQPPKPSANISDFEWYREMAQIDKGSKFGVELGAGSITSPPATLNIPHQSGLAYGAHKGTTPIHESEVVDMVMDMMPSADMERCQSADSNKILGDLMHTDEDTKSVCSMPTQLGEDSNHSTLLASGSGPGVLQAQTVETVPPPEEGTVDANLMAEFHKLLNSMEESDIKLLANQVDSSAEIKEEKSGDLLKEDTEGPLNNLNAYLGSYSQEESVATGPPMAAQSSQFLDLDDINDSDLLNSAELGNMSAIFGDLTTSGAPSSSTSSVIASGRLLDSPTKTSTGAGFSGFGDTTDTYNIENSNNIDSNLTTTTAAARNLLSGFGKPLDKTELFPDISAPPTPTTTEFSGAPELTLVNMYWNDIPGLVVSGKEYVRLVDIHKQVLPAKDTGILKKRCQMMGLEIQNCSELQRDFLMRYMNAAKSKSCVIVQKEAAKSLIGFYVDPRPRMVNKQASSEDTTAAARSPTPSAAPWRDEDTTSSVDTVIAPETSKMDSNETVNVCDVEVVAPKKTGSKVKSWTMHDHSHAKPELKTPKPPTPAEPKVVKVKAPRTPTVSRSPAVVAKQPTTPVTPTTGATPLSSLDLKRSARLKNKKVQYAALHSGVWGEEDEPQTPRTSKAPPAPSPTDNNGVVPAQPLRTVVVSPGKPRVLKVPLLSHRSRLRHQADELELRKLTAKQKKAKLNVKEKRRVRRLRDKLRRHDNTDDSTRWLKERRERLLRSLEQAKRKRRREQKSAKAEHCYATVPAGEDRVVVVVSGGEENDAREVRPRQPPVRVLHRDGVVRGQRGRTQEGLLHPGLYVRKEATCIECVTCGEMLSVRRFLQHRHHLHSPDELVAVTLPQRLELCADTEASDRDVWAAFSHKRQMFAVAPRRTPKTPRKLSPKTPRNRPDQKPAKESLREVQNKASPPPSVTPDPDLTPSGVRHSGRARKRKQLHPMESYVFARRLSQGSPEQKRGRPRSNSRRREQGLG